MPPFRVLVLVPAGATLPVDNTAQLPRDGLPSLLNRPGQESLFSPNFFVNFVNTNNESTLVRKTSKKKNDTCPVRPHPACRRLACKKALCRAVAPYPRLELNDEQKPRQRLPQLLSLTHIAAIDYVTPWFSITGFLEVVLGVPQILFFRWG